MRSTRVQQLIPSVHCCSRSPRAAVPALPASRELRCLITDVSRALYSTASSRSLPSSVWLPRTVWEHIGPMLRVGRVVKGRLTLWQWMAQSQLLSSEDTPAITRPAFRLLSSRYDVWMTPTWCTFPSCCTFLHQVTKQYVAPCMMHAGKPPQATWLLPVRTQFTAAAHPEVPAVLHLIVLPGWHRRSCLRQLVWTCQLDQRGSEVRTTCPKQSVQRGP